MALIIRAFTGQDSAATARIHFDAIRIGALGPYSAAEVEAWLPEIPDEKDWKARLSAQRTFVAEKNGEPVGFLTLDDTGYIDLAFVSPAVKGQGVAYALYRNLEAEAQKSGISRLTVQASLLAHVFFLRQGWTELAEEKVERGGQTLVRYKMEKRLD